jgi:hypothetical protein
MKFEMQNHQRHVNGIIWNITLPVLTIPSGAAFTISAKVQAGLKVDLVQYGDWPDNSLAPNTTLVKTSVNAIMHLPFLINLWASSIRAWMTFSSTSCGLMLLSVTEICNFLMSATGGGGLRPCPRLISGIPPG